MIEIRRCSGTQFDPKLTEIFLRSDVETFRKLLSNHQEQTRRLAEKREILQAAARGELSTRVVDLVEGAPELLAFGATASELSRISAGDAELTRIATATARTAGTGAALITLLSGLTVWGVLLAGVPAVNASRLSGPLLAVITLTPLALFTLDSGNWETRRAAAPAPVLSPVPAAA